MSDLRALAEVANRPAPPSMHHGFINDDYLVWRTARRAFEEAATPFAVLALLDKLDTASRALNDIHWLGINHQNIIDSPERFHDLFVGALEDVEKARAALEEPTP